MKAVILAAGRGTRLGAVSQEQNKCMVVVHGKHLIEYSLDSVAALEEISQIIIVIGYKGDEIQAQYGARYRGKELIFVQQLEQHGLVHAIECCRPVLGKSDFMLMLGDELMINPHHAEFIAEFARSKVSVLCGVVYVQDTELIRKTYTVIQGPDARVFRLIEKPGYIFNNMMGTGNCVFTNAVLDYIGKTPINQNRGEKELPDLIQCVVDAGQIVKTFPICTSYVNVNSPEELERTKSYFAHF
jgi:UDP-N-acetylglucosamine diphosphorylase / glucose-1-phosphate thymidylyltransferase / UDP-N-acetylgalactosamine diphosphorylase / glucosamine-1-phosphate N-acetyltransferase / galactosamine-1-phosphate N-acetyltransferase